MYFYNNKKSGVGLVARLNPVYSIQSAKSVYPLAIANCKENSWFIINFCDSMLPKYFFAFAWHGYKLFTTRSIKTFPFKLSLLKTCRFVDYNYVAVFIVVMLAFQWLQDLANVTHTTKKYPHTIKQKEKKPKTLLQYKNFTWDSTSSIKNKFHWLSLMSNVILIGKA